MIKYSVMDFEDVENFQKFKINNGEKEESYIKLPRFFKSMPENAYDYNSAKSHMTSYELPKFKENPRIINAYKIVEGFPKLNKYTFIENNVECIVNYTENASIKE